MDSNIRRILNESLDKICCALKDSLTIIEYTSEDQRINSILNEKDTLKKINAICVDIENIEYIPAPISRNWYDFALKINGHFVPVNLKMTEKFGNDNVNSKEGLFWTFFNIEPSNNRRWSEYKKIFENQTPNITSNKDYYFLIVNKKDVSDIFYTSFKQIKSLNPNANNLPFQSNWDKNRELASKPPLEEYRYPFSVFQKSLNSLELIAKTLESFDEGNSHE